jgi:hypothetical protein
MIIAVGIDIFILAFIFLLNQPKKYSNGKYIPIIVFSLILASSAVTSIGLFINKAYGFLIFSLLFGFFSIYILIKSLLIKKNQQIKIVTIKKEEINFEIHYPEVFAYESPSIPDRTLIFNDLKIKVPINFNIPRDAEEITVYYNEKNNDAVFVEAKKVKNKVNLLNFINTLIICLSALASPVVLTYELNHKTANLEFSNSLGINLIFLAIWGIGMKTFSLLLNVDNKQWFHKFLKVLLSVFYYLEICAIIANFC